MENLMKIYATAGRLPPIAYSLLHLSFVRGGMFQESECKLVSTHFLLQPLTC
jgi:hypothetical protein